MEQQVTFPCMQCGASLEFVPGATSLKCPYCGTETPITVQQAPICELDYRAYLASMTEDDMTEEIALVKCASCGAETRVTNLKAYDCPFCGSPHVLNTSRRLITPKSLLPFLVTRDQAMRVFHAWINSLWFAPNELKRYASLDSQKLQGVYLPYWTYDSDTFSEYSGQRGEHYWETEHYTTTENGQQVTKTRQVQRTRWYPAHGVVRNLFDDILVLASKSLDQRYADQLEPWDLQDLVPYQEEFLSGLRAESYQIDLVNGFEIAKGKMAPSIRQTIRGDIGGDEQRIHAVETTYQTVSFKHLLLPLWLCTYRYRDASYRIMINARTGEITGDRPWSWIKIMLLVLLIVLIIGLLIVLYQHHAAETQRALNVSMP